MMQEVWIKVGLNPEHYTSSTGEAMKQFAMLFANFIGNRPLSEYSESTDKWRWWDNATRDYKYGSTADLMAQFVVSNGQDNAEKIKRIAADEMKYGNRAWE